MPNKCWLTLGPLQGCCWQESADSVPGLQEHEQSRGIPGQKDSTQVMGAALALRPCRMGGEMSVAHDGW